MNYQNYIPFIAIIGYFAFRYLKFKKIKTKLPILLQQGAIILDVRTQNEFSLSANPKSLNIPLNELSRRLNELNKEKMVIVCCASGTRSGMALGILKKNGFNNLINAGSWINTLV